MVQNALNTHSSAAPKNADSRSAGWSRTRSTSDRMRAGHRRLLCLGSFGNRARSNNINASIPSAAIPYTERHPKNDASTPLNVRASRIPISSPLKTVPSTRPRLFSGASCAAKGTITCTAAPHRPTAKLATEIQMRFRAVATPHNARHAPTSSAVRSARRSKLSPSGTKTSMPIAVPTWVSIATSPIMPTLTENVRAIAASNGCT